ncbi:hypothetical protein EW145_g2766 [Phellinidium pouzarii]|uniref:MARVEL domain-containing protein n=1 Tax=Phellinidium pouzarii TaxID=167371 RepID=A0A4S4LF39_9AGAM|nr:hypothetical protein EW145_g2766 [Phellinidium pouzarii]
MVDYDRHIRRGHPVLFGLIVLFAIIEGSISSWLASRYGRHHNFPSTAVRDRTSFLAFTSWWTVLFGILYIALFLHSASSGSVLTSVGSHGLFLVITWIFWTAGAASITSALGGGNNCSNIDFPLLYCNQLNAEEGFAWVVWIFVSLALLVVLFRGCASTRRGDGLRGQLVTV